MYAAKLWCGACEGMTEELGRKAPLGSFTTKCRVGGHIVKVAVGRQQGRTCAVALRKRGNGGFERWDTRVEVSEEAKARSMVKRAA